MREETLNHIRELLDAGVIEPANSEWVSAVIFAPKKGGKLRFCVEYRRLNLETVADTYPLPRLDDCIDTLGEASVLSRLDANCWFWRIPIFDPDRNKTCFTMYSGTYGYRRMPFGLRNAPATFHRALDIILGGVRWQGYLISLDVVIMISLSAAQHVKDVDEILGLLQGAG